MDEALKALDGRFNEIYGQDGRRSIPPERLLRAPQRETRFRGPDRVGWMFTFAAAAYNLVRMRNLMAQTA